MKFLYLLFGIATSASIGRDVAEPVLKKCKRAFKAQSDGFQEIPKGHIMMTNIPTKEADC